MAAQLTIIFIFFSITFFSQSVAPNDLIAEPNRSHKVGKKNMSTPPIKDVPVFNSYKGGDGVVYLDFDGYLLDNEWWVHYFSENGKAISCGAAKLTKQEIQEIYAVVREDFLPFTLNITTHLSEYLKYPTDKRQRVVITEDYSWQEYSKAGLARLGSFHKNDSPCFVFSSRFVDHLDIAETISHEIGHALGLNHDGKILPQKDYYNGANYGPIMGNTGKGKISHWSRGEYVNASNKEDDLSIITSLTNGVRYRADDYSNSFLNAEVLKEVADNRTYQKGIISFNSDLDYFRFYTLGGSINLLIGNLINRPNLNISALIYDSDYNMVGDFINDTLPSVMIDTVLQEGQYFLVVQGVEELPYLDQGYSRYGSLGEYVITGYIDNFISQGEKPTTYIIHLTNSDHVLYDEQKVSFCLETNAIDQFVRVDEASLFVHSFGENRCYSWYKDNRSIVEFDVALLGKNGHKINFTFEQQLLYRKIEAPLFYPSPVVDVLSFSGQALSKGQGIFRLFSIEGDQLHSEEINFEGKFIKEIFLEDIEQGIYVVEIQFFDQLIRDRIMFD